MTDSYTLINNEKQYLSELKVMSHTGSGPVDPAPEEKEVKSPEADTKGVGTQQSGTKDPGKIPSIPSLKKDLAKEGIELKGKSPEDVVAEIRALPDEQQAIVMQKVSEYKETLSEIDPITMGAVAGIGALGLAAQANARRQCAKKHKKGSKEYDDCYRSKVTHIGRSKKEGKEILSFKEELELAIEMCGASHGEEKKSKKIKEEKKPDFADLDKDGDEEEPMEKAVKDKEEKCPDCGKDKCECSKEAAKIKEQDEAPEGADQEMKDEEEAEGAETEANEDIGEQLSVKQQARLSGKQDNPPPVPGGQTANRIAANTPPAEIEKLRRPIPQPRTVTPGLTGKGSAGSRPVRMGRI
jgi:hypothetical protein